MRQRQGSSATNNIRIIGGNWRSRRLPVLNADGLRPTSDRMRETLFNWLAFDVANARVADLFAGSGALAFESLSRGAASAVLIDNYSPACDQLRENAALLSASAEIINSDSRSWLNKKSHRQFNLVFLDPPFADPCHDHIIDLLIENQWLASDALLYAESERSCNWTSHRAELQLSKQTQSNEASAQLYKFYD